MRELTLSDGHPVRLKPIPVRKFRGIRLPGAELLNAEEERFAIYFHNYATGLFHLSLRSFNCLEKLDFTLKESAQYLRLETVLTGELLIRDTNGKETRLLAGQYRIADSITYQLRFHPSGDCQYLAVLISPQLLSQTPMAEDIVPSEPRMMHKPMREVITRMLDNPFGEKFRDALYDYSIRELLFYHVSAPPFTLPGELTEAEIAAVYAADAIIAANLNVHYSIHKLARMVNSNVYTLKVGFARIFGMGTFERLLQRKMDRAKYLLETTDKQIQEISEMAGYDTVTGFINAFRKHFKMTPKDWRKKSRGML